MRSQNWLPIADLDNNGNKSSTSSTVAGLEIRQNLSLRRSKEAFRYDSSIVLLRGASSPDRSPGSGQFQACLPPSRPDPALSAKADCGLGKGQRPDGRRRGRPLGGGHRRPPVPSGPRSRRPQEKEERKRMVVDALAQCVFADGSRRARTCSLVVNDLLDGLQASPFVGQIEWLEDERERSVVTAHALNRSLQPQETPLLQKLMGNVHS